MAQSEATAAPASGRHKWEEIGLTASRAGRPRNGTQSANGASKSYSRKVKRSFARSTCWAPMHNDSNPDRATPDVPDRAVIVLEARHVKKSYGTGVKFLPILVDANLSLRRGEMVAIVAPSGAGKSTLLHLLAALDTLTSGAVYFATKAIETKLDAAVAEYRNRAVGFLWQRHQLLPDFNAAQNVDLPLLLRGEN